MSTNYESTVPYETGIRKQNYFASDLISNVLGGASVFCMGKALTVVKKPTNN